jgi:crotonobetainyl-CoA:carnitine CoA-transferase CaiB-like acyl-CoA transferase
MAGLRDRYRRDGNASDGTYAFQRHAIDGGSVELFAPCAIRPAAAPILSFPPAEKYGASTRGVLRELGYGDDEIDSLIRTKCVSTSWSTQYLPD